MLCRSCSGVKVKSLSDDLDKNSTPVSPSKRFPPGNEEPSTGRRDTAEGKDKDDAGGSDEVCYQKPISRVSPCQARL